MRNTSSERMASIAELARDYAQIESKPTVDTGLVAPSEMKSDFDRRYRNSILGVVRSSCNNVEMAYFCMEVAANVRHPAQTLTVLCNQLLKYEGV